MSLFYKEIPIFAENESIQTHLSSILKAPKFTKFIDTFDFDKMEIRKINILVAYWFCPSSSISPEKLGFLVLDAQIFDKQSGKKVPGFIVLRGGAIAVLIRVVIKETGQSYFLLCEQNRSPTGKAIYEIPAGMLDAQLNPAGAMMKEIHEETGLIVPNVEELVKLGNPYYTSQGLLDEQIQLYFWQTSVSVAKFKEMKKKVYGAQNENENIRLHFVPESYFPSFIEEISDAKAEIAYYRWKNL